MPDTRHILLTVILLAALSSLSCASKHSPEPAETSQNDTLLEQSYYAERNRMEHETITLGDKNDSPVFDERFLEEFERQLPNYPDEPVVFIREYTFQAAETDSKISSREQALTQVKRQLLEEIGSFLYSRTQVDNFMLTKDQMVSMTSGFVKAEILEEEWDGRTYRLKAKVEAVPRDVMTSMISTLRYSR